MFGKSQLQSRPTTLQSTTQFSTIQPRQPRSEWWRSLIPSASWEWSKACPSLLAVCLTAAFVLVLSAVFASAQTSGSSSLNGVVTDPSGAVVPGATVEIQNPVSEFSRTTQTDATGRFSFPNVPLNPYHLTVNLSGFAPYVEDVDVRSAVAVNLKVTLKISSTAENITVQAEAGDLVENDPTFHTDVDRALFDKLPLESASSELSSLVTLASPGIAADSNGLFHGLGDHAENSFSLDG